MKFKSFARQLFWVSLALFSAQGFALSLTQDFNFSGTLLDDTTGDPMSGPVAIKFQILNPAVNCILFEETHSAVTLDAAGGFNAQVGAGTRASSSVDGGLTFKTIFNNATTAVRSAGTNCSSGYTAAAGDGRKLRVIVNGTTLSPDFAISSVPMATVAESLEGKVASDFVAVTGATMTGALKMASMGEVQFGSTSSIYFALKAPTGMSSNVSMTLPNSAGSANQLLSTDGSGTLSWITPGSGGTVTSITAGAGITTGGSAITTSGTIGLGNVGVAGTYSKVTTDVYGRVASGAALADADIPTLTSAGKVSGATITSGTISGSTAINSTGAITTTGAITGASLSSTTDSTKNLRIFETTNTNKVTINAPTTFSDYTLTLPTTVGSSGEVLSTDGSGTLSWISAGGGGISALTGDVTASGSGSVAATIAANAVSASKIANNSITSNKISSTGVAVNRLLMTDASTGSSVTYATCSTTGEQLQWTVSGWACSGAPLWASVAGNTVLASGFVGIGTTNPSMPLQIDSTGQMGLRVEATDSGSNDGTPLILSNGVGEWAFRVSNSYGDALIIDAPAAPEAVYINSGGQMGLGTYPNMSLGFVGNGTPHTIGIQRPLAPGVGNSLTISAGGAYPTETNAPGGDLWLESGTGTGNQGSAILFKTSTPGTSGSADRAPDIKMVISPEGYIGMGTDVPSHNLELKSAGSNQFLMENGGVSDMNMLLFHTVDQDRYAGLNLANDGFDFIVQDMIPLRMGTGNSEQMRISSTGNVGIGTPTPSYPLSVNGVIQTTAGISFPDTTLQTTAGFVMFSGNTNNGTLAISTTSYAPLSGSFTPVSTDYSAGTRTLLSRGGYLGRFHARASSAGNATYYIYVNGSPTGITCNISSTTTCDDLVNSYPVSALDEVTVKIVTGSGTSLKHSWALELAY